MQDYAPDAMFSDASLRGMPYASTHYGLKEEQNPDVTGRKEESYNYRTKNFNYSRYQRYVHNTPAYDSPQSPTWLNEVHPQVLPSFHDPRTVESPTTDGTLVNWLTERHLHDSFYFVNEPPKPLLNAKTPDNYDFEGRTANYAIDEPSNYYTLHAQPSSLKDGSGLLSRDQFHSLEPRGPEEPIPQDMTDFLNVIFPERANMPPAGGTASLRQVSPGDTKTHMDQCGASTILMEHQTPIVHRNRPSRKSAIACIEKVRKCCDSYVTSPSSDEHACKLHLYKAAPAKEVKQVSRKSPKDDDFICKTSDSQTVDDSLAERKRKSNEAAKRSRNKRKMKEENDKEECRRLEKRHSYLKAKSAELQKVVNYLMEAVTRNQPTVQVFSK